MLPRIEQAVKAELQKVKAVLDSEEESFFKPGVFIDLDDYDVDAVSEDIIDLLNNIKNKCSERGDYNEEEKESKLKKETCYMCTLCTEFSTNKTGMKSGAAAEHLKRKHKIRSGRDMKPGIFKKLKT